MFRWRKGYKYQVAHDYQVVTGIPNDKARRVSCEFLKLDDGRLTIRAGYAWDGPSGPTWDTGRAMRASCVHDALYQLIRRQLLTPAATARRRADLLFYEMLREDGMWLPRATYYFMAVFMFGGRAASPVSRRTVYCSPDGSQVAVTLEDPDG